MKRIEVGLVGALMAAMIVVWMTVTPATGQSVEATIKLQLDILNKLAVGLTTVTDRLERDYTRLFGSGTGSNQANAMYHASRSLTASATEDLDLNASLTDVFGASLTCTKIKALLIKAGDGNTNNVLIGGVNTTITTMFSDISDRIQLRPGGVFLYTAPSNPGAALTAGSADVLTIANSGAGTTVIYDIVLVCVE